LCKNGDVNTKTNCIYLDKEITKTILIEANKRRFSPEIQASYNVYNNSEWFAFVTNRMHADILEEMGYVGNDLNFALEQVYSARWIYRDDEEMNMFFKTLIHVQMDFTGDGPIQVGDTAVSVVLHELDQKEIELSFFLEQAQQMNRPLVVFSGSWT